MTIPICKLHPVFKAFSRYIWLAIALIAIGAYFSGAFDHTPKISVGGNEKIIFTDRLPSTDDKNVIACFPAAYSGSDGIIGHYSVGTGRRGKSDYRYTTIHLDNNTCFQQATLVKSHKPRKFSDSKIRYRRALCRKDGRYFIEHSKWPVTLDAFARQLTAYDNAWNLDMGTYSYGWYRDHEGEIHHLGLSTIWNRGNQTNWILITTGQPSH